MSKVIIAGSRRFPSLGLTTYKNYKNIKKWQPLYDILCKEMFNITERIEEIVSGECWGMDKLGEIWAGYHHATIKRFPANWDKYGPSAGFRRNEEMAQYADALVCIHTGSSGSQHMINCMKKLGKPYYERIIK